MGLIASPHVKLVNELIHLRGSPVMDDVLTDASGRLLYARAGDHGLENTLLGSMTSPWLYPSVFLLPVPFHRMFFIICPTLSPYPLLS